MSRQEDLAYVEYELREKGFECFYEPFERDRPDMIAISEETIIVIELKTGREASSKVFQQMMWMKQRQNLIEPTETIWFYVQVVRKANQSNGSSAAGKKAI